MAHAVGDFRFQPPPDSIIVPGSGIDICKPETRLVCRHLPHSNIHRVVVVIQSQAGVHPGVDAKRLINYHLPGTVLFVELVGQRTFLMTVFLQIAGLRDCQSLRIPVIGCQTDLVTLCAEHPGDLLGGFPRCGHLIQHPVHF